jgi:hypothetical protein
MAQSDQVTGSAARALGALGAALDSALSPPGGAITLGTETQVHNALDLLRSARGEPGVVAQLEELAATLRIMMEAKRQGRVNLYASKLARLRRAFFA